MENDQKPRPRMKHPDRVSLSPDSLAKISQWISEAQMRLKGSRLTKSDLVNFLIMSHSTTLTEREIDELEREHFDEVRFAAWALRQIKEARAQGKELSLTDVMKSTPNSKADTDSPPKSPKSPK